MLLALILLSMPAHAADHRGGTMRLLSRSAAGTIDPQINYTQQYWQIFSLAYDGLVAFRKVPGPDGNQIVPDLALALPERPDPLTYVFTLRPGLRFSDGQAVRGADVVASFQRMAKVGTPTAGTFYAAIRSVSAEGEVVTLRLSRPDPELLQKLALPHASILPADAPGTDTGMRPLPGTGPYRILSYDPNDRMRLDRNPYFKQWSGDAQPDGFPDAIDYEFGLEDEAAITAIQNNQADWTFDTPPADRLDELGRRYANQVHLNPAFALWFLPLNTRIPPFDDIRVRRAINLAVDRRVPVKLFGGARLATATCQWVPPGLPGHQPYCPYNYDLAQARALVADSGTAGQTVTIVTDDSPSNRAIGTYMLDVLRDIGFVPRLRTLSGNVQFPFIQNTNNRVQISLTSWYADFPSAASIIEGNLGCAAFRPGSDASTNIPGFCDPAIDAALADADPAGIAAVDRAVTDAAPAVVLFNPRYIDVVSARVGNVQYHEQVRWLIGQSWVQ